MKQEVSPKVLFAVIAVLVILVAGGMLWVWRAPTAGAATGSTSNASPGRSKSETQAMAQEKRQEMMRIRQHQGAANAGGESAKPNGGP